jgi:predicted DNA-binding transcriptional regulator AlpA
VASGQISRAREIVLHRFLELEPKEQLETYRDIRDYLGARLVLVKRDNAVEERAESLDVLSRVVTHLELPEGVAPTPAQFDRVSRELNLGWNRSRVTRAWGRWRLGKDAYLGGDHDSATRRRIRRPIDRRRRYEEPLRGVRLWLETDPPARTARDYMAWAREHNANLDQGALRVRVSGALIASSSGMTWKDLLRVAVGEIAAADARPSKKRPVKVYSRSPHDLVSRQDVARILGVTETAINDHIGKSYFPTAVIDLPSKRFWVRADVEAYRDDRPIPVRQPNELRHAYMTVAEVSAATEMPERSVHKRLRGLPEPVLSGRVSVWLRDEIERWLAEGH